MIQSLACRDPQTLKTLPKVHVRKLEKHSCLKPCQEGSEMVS